MKKKIIAVLCFVFLIGAICPIPTAHAWAWNRALVEGLWTNGRYVWVPKLVTHYGDWPFDVNGDNVVSVSTDANGNKYWVEDQGEWVWQEWPINNNS